MYLFIGVSIALFFGLVFTLVAVNREEISRNWSKYRYDPLYLFAAPLFKPADDPRSRMEFGFDNFKDAINLNINNVFLRFLQPVFSIFKIFLDAMNQTLGGLFGIKAIIGKYWNAFHRMIDPFMRRFGTTFHQLRLTFMKLNQAFGKITGIVTSSVYAGLSTISTITSFIDLMIKIIIIILIILVVIVILLFFVLWPLIPLILSVVAIITFTTFGSEVGGMANTFCFDEHTQVLTKDRGAVSIRNLRNGDVLANGAVVQGTMMFETPSDDLYNLHGVIVSGSHIVFNKDNEPIFVYEHEESIPMHPTPESRLYCVITSTHRIPILSTRGVLTFADWEEISSDADLLAWHKQVFETLNTRVAPEYAEAPTPTPDILHSEAVLSGRTKIWTPLGPCDIRGIRPGDAVLDGNGNPTTVKGVVCVDGSQVRSAAHLGGEAWISAAAWTSTDGLSWTHPEQTGPAHGIHEWYSLFTDAGTFRLCEPGAIGLRMRDFTDIGADRIHETYDWVLEALDAQLKIDH
jgi:hypothetical protein